MRSKSSQVKFSLGGSRRLTLNPFFSFGFSFSFYSAAQHIIVEAGPSLYQRRLSGITLYVSSALGGDKE